MKRSFGILTGLGILGAMGYVGGNLLAQQGYPQPNQGVRQVSAQSPQSTMAPRPLRTRIALVNILEVLKEYKKAKTFQEQVTYQAKTIDTQQLQPLRNQLIQMRNELAKQQDAAQRERLERDMRRVQLDLQEKEEAARKQLAEMQGQFTVQLYREVEEAVKLFAVSNDIELVLFFADPTDDKDPNNPMAIQAKLTTRGALPIYHAPNMDITSAVVGMLNQRITGNTTGGPGGGQ